MAHSRAADARSSWTDLYAWHSTCAYTKLFHLALTVPSGTLSPRPGRPPPHPAFSHLLPTSGARAKNSRKVRHFGTFWDTRKAPIERTKTSVAFAFAQSAPIAKGGVRHRSDSATCLWPAKMHREPGAGTARAIRSHSRARRRLAEKVPSSAILCHSQFGLFSVEAREDRVDWCRRGGTDHRGPMDRSGA